MSKQRSLGGIIGMLCLLLSATWAGAQTNSNIAGTVKDATGAVLPGVNVEASSPALIEKVRSVVTDGTGQYKIIELSPGTYTVTFTLPGFGSVRRTGIELTTGFTATANAELRVADVAETITVSGASPVVDLQNVVQQSVMTRNIIDELPTGKVFANLAALIPGMNVTGLGRPQDVGGSAGAQNQRLFIHGGVVGDMTQMVDGMSIAGMEGGTGTSLAVYSDAAVEEINLGVGALSAEAETGGVQVNIIPKSGGNVFSGIVPMSYTNEHFQSKNLTDTMKSQGLGKYRTDIREIWDFNPGVGGPLLSDRLWFYGAYRVWHTTTFSGSPYDLNPTDWAFTPDPNRGAVPAPQEIWNLTGRLTWQAWAKSRLSLNFAHDDRCDCPSYLTATQPFEAGYNKVIPTNLAQTTWVAPITNRFLLQAGWSRMRMPNRFVETTGAISPPALELNGNIQLRSASGTSGGYVEGYGALNTWHHIARASASYVTGAHSLKVGTLFDLGTSRVDKYAKGDYLVVLLNGVPNQAQYFAMPFTARTEMRKLALFVQDQWSVKRLTINAGLRFDRLKTYYPEVGLPVNNLLPARNFPGADVLDWKDLSPRVGASYDLFGNGKTALKVSLSRYLTGETIDSTTEVHPAHAAGGRLSRAWNDANGDFIPQGDPLNPLANGELIAPSTNVSFGKPVLTLRHDPAWDEGWGVRPNNWETSASVQHELVPRFSVSAGYFRRVYGNFSLINNRAVSASDYDPYCITAPQDSRLPEGGGQRLCGLYNISQAKLGQLDRVRTFSSNFGDEYRRWQGGDFTIDMRLADGTLLQGGLSTGRTISDNCDIVTKYPQFLATSTPLDYCHDVQPWVNQWKFSGSYALPWDVRAAAAFQSIPGPVTAANYVATNAQIAPSLGRNLSAGANATVNVNIVRPGSVMLDRLNQLDLRFSRSFGLSRSRLKGMVDFYNVLNANAVQTVNASYGTNGATWLFPTQILQGRLVKFGVQWDF